MLLKFCTATDKDSIDTLRTKGGQKIALQPPVRLNGFFSEMSIGESIRLGKEIFQGNDTEVLV